MNKIKRKKKNVNKNQKSFYFEDYLETNQNFSNKKKFLISVDRVYLLFFCFFSLISIFAFKIIIVSVQSSNFSEAISNNSNFVSLRRDIMDRNKVILARNIKAYHAAVNPSLVKDKKKFAVKVKLALPEIDILNLLAKLEKNKYFYIRKRLSADQRDKLWKLGERGLIFEPFQTRVYPQSDLYSHILGQVDYDNYGLSGIEYFYDKALRDLKKIDKKLTLTLDTNLQYIVKEELENSLKIFDAKGAAALLLDAKNGEILSLVSLPDYNLNKREKIDDVKYMNKITNGVFELGSIFKTFTIALALDEKLVEPKTSITGIDKKMKCSIHEISDIKNFPQTMTVEDILIQSSNIGTIKIAQKIGEEKYKKFLNKIDILKTSKVELNEIGNPIPFDWNKCKLETISYGHGITTTPLQAAAVYAGLVNGGKLVNPTLIKGKNGLKKRKQIVSEDTSNKIKMILRKVVTEEKGTASLADVFGYEVLGKTGTSQNYLDKNKNINTFISSFEATKKSYVLLVMLDDPQIAKNLIYDYRGYKIKGTRNEAGWNAVYSAGKIIEKIGPILAINNYDVGDSYVVKKTN